ncbi:MAG TPA: phosphatidate cytidylyltransferase [Clostridia bacterium]|nr:phosphatidate cytidylyltransferase [Clostridia bacterium]
MKTRVITGIVGGLFAILVLCFMHTVALPVVVSMFCVIAVYEMETVSGLKNFPIMIATLLLSATIPFVFHFKITFTKQIYISFAIAYTLILFLLMLLLYEKTKFEQVVIALFSSIAIPVSISIVILLRDIYIKYPSYTKSEAVFLVLLALFTSWLTDAFAFFAGKKFGKHKMCPNISPKKTVEGAIGGIVGQAFLSLVLFYVFNKFFFTGESYLSYAAVILLSVFLSAISMCGDLTASTVKRNYGVKDFGTFFPGHGGVMDRFDSCLFVLPALYAFAIITA